MTKATCSGDFGCDNKMPRIRPPWCRVREQFVFTLPSMTQASHGNQTDINNIIARFKRDGYMPQATQQPQYADVTELQHDLTTLHMRAEDTLTRANMFAKGWKPKPLEDALAPSGDAQGSRQDPPPAPNP